MTPRVFAGAAGAVLLVVAAVLALWPSSTASIAGRSADCGSMLFPASVGSASSLDALSCQAMHDSRAVWVFVLAGIGALIIVGALLVRSPSKATA